MIQCSVVVKDVNKGKIVALAKGKIVGVMRRSTGLYISAVGKRWKASCFQDDSRDFDGASPEL